MDAGAWLEAAPWPLALLDADLRLRATNQRLCVLVGRTSAELAQQPYHALGGAGDLEREHAAVLALARGALAVELDQRMVTSDGRILAVRMELLALPPPAPAGELLLCLRPAAAGASTAAQAGADALLRRSLLQASACAGHDLREQARLAACFLGALTEHHQGELPAAASALLSHAVGHADRLLTMLPALADYLRAAALPATRAPTDCGAVVARAHARLDARLRSAIELSHDPLPTIDADASALEEVLVQLLANAALHHHPGAVRVHLACQRAPAAGGWQFACADDGPGLPAALLARLFQPFAGGPGAHAGLGLGLARCRLEIERMGGRIWHDNAAAGTCIRFSLPD